MTYECLFTGVMQTASTPRTVRLRHYDDGPFLEVDCTQFDPTDKYQINVLTKNSSGWHMAETSAYCLTDTSIDVSEYTKECIEYALREACESSQLESGFFQITSYHRDVAVVQDCLHLYTTLRLLCLGWRFTGEETLEMAAIEDESSAWYKIKPVPRMVQNQLNHLLEIQMIELDKKILTTIHKAMQDRQRHTWVVTTLTTFLLLHIRELDAGRNIYWKRYEDICGFWIHPSKPAALIDEAVASCNSLLWHYHLSFGKKALTLDWDKQSSKDMLENNGFLITSMKAIQLYVSYLRAEGKLGRKASDLYVDGNPGSVAFTFSSMLFVHTNECQVSDVE
ncbi:unnamed protein product [Zymoseptoria tritici ST99CH_1A5]|nr:unnamed protein product [Zymoseptoria tritici ST99CH_1A5]